MKIKKFSPVRTPEFVIADFKACIRHALNAGHDPDCRYDSVTGREVNTAEYGFRTFLDMYVSHWLDNYSPWQILVAHDSGYAYRTAISSSYKENRVQAEGEEPKKGPEEKEELQKLSNYAKSFLAGIGATQLQVDGVEADDIIAHLVEKLSPKYLCSIYSVDADMLRLINKNTMVWLKLKYVVNNYETFSDCEDNVPKNMHGYLQAMCDADGYFHDDIKDNVFQLLTLYKSLIGDTADGYKGVDGLGPAKWKTLISEYGIDGMFELQKLVADRNWVELKEVLEADPSDKIIAKIYNAREEWRTSWLLAELHPELCWKPYNKKITKINYFKRVPNADRVLKVLRECMVEEYFEERIESLMPQKWLIDSSNFEAADLQEFTDLCKSSPVVGWDYETTAEEFRPKTFNSTGSVPNGISFCLGDNLQYSFYVTLDHKDSNNLPLSTALDFINAIPEDTPTVAHNLKFETIVTAKNYDTIVDGGYDTAVMASYVDENEEAGLKACSKRELNYTQETYDEVLEKAGADNMRDVTAQQVMSYGIDDSIVCAHLYNLYWLRMQLEDSWEFYSEYEPTFTKRTALSELTGCNVDIKRLEKIHAEDASDIEKNTVRLREILAENCSSKPNTEAVSRYISADVDFIKQNTKAKLNKLEDDGLIKKASAGLAYLENLVEIDDDAGAILAKLQELVAKATEKQEINKSIIVVLLVKLEVYKITQKALVGSVYVPYKVSKETAELAPTLKNLNEVVKLIGLPELSSVATSKVSEWEADVRNYDFDSETDDFDNMSEDQQDFLTLLTNAKMHFKKDSRGHEAYLAFQEFCCDKLGKQGKEVYSGTELNTGSSQQMQYLLYCMLGLPVRLRSKVAKGSARHTLGFEGSCGTDALAVDTALAEDIDGKEGMEWVGEALNCIKRIKESETRISLYHKPYPELVHPETGRIHPQLRSCGTVTRRPTCSNPNILQVSKHQKGGAMRGVFLPIGEEDVIVSMDFAGQELRILASVTKDVNLLSAYLGSALTSEYLKCVGDGEPWDITTNDIYGLPDVKDLHSNTGSRIVAIFGLDADGKLVAGGNPVVKCKAMTYEIFAEALENKDSEFHSLANKVRKRPAKTSNFLMAYGGSAQALSQKLIIKESEGQSIVDAMMKLYPNIELEQANAIKFAKTHGYTETAYGNRRHATNDLFSKNGSEVSRIGRQLFNSEIQGCAADILKVVMKGAEDKNVWSDYSATMMAPVYDEIVASVPVKHVASYVSDMTKIMNILPPNQAVPMMADISLGPDWQKQRELGSFPTAEELTEAAEKAFEEVLERRGCDE